MISVLVTEDELPILRSTSKLIEKCNSCFYVKYRATNGQEALEIIKQNNIDLLVLDIHMPVMNGIDLLKIMQKEEIKIPTVVLSGYQDFQYVRQAMLLGAMDYLLKPLKISDLNNILFKAEGIILYNNCINKKISKKNSITCNSAYELALINFDDKAILNEEQQLTKEQKKIETNLEEFLVNSISKEDYWIFQDKQLIEKTFIFRKSGHRTENLLKTFFNEYSNHINKITIVVSNTEYQLNTLYEGNKKINDHLREVICINKSVFSVLEENQSNKENINQIQEYKNFIKTAQFPEEIFGKIQDTLKNISRKTVILELLKIAFIHYSNKFNTNSTYLNIEENLKKIIFCNNSLEELLKTLENIIIETFYNENKRNVKEKLALEIKNYLDENFYRQISNNTLEEVFGFVPAHLRDIFRKKYGESPMDYLQNIRIEKSREWLTANKDLSVKELSERVGFADSLYFSKVFRKRFGLSPSEYKKMEKNNER